MKIAMNIEDILAKVRADQSITNRADTYEEYKRKNGIDTTGGYADAVNALYASLRRGSSSYGQNNRQISNKGLQSSGYAAYIDELGKTKFDSGLTKIKDDYAKRESNASLGYVGYLEKYADKQNTLKKSVMTHLVNNDVVDLNTAIAYGLSAGLSREDAESVGKSAYDVTKQKVFNSILAQTVSLGLDKEGARKLAIKMGVSESDAESFAEEIGDMLDYYGNISKEYLEFLEQRTQ